MSAKSLDYLLTNATEALLSAMTSVPGSADEVRYMRAVRILMHAAEQIQGGAA